MKRLHLLRDIGIKIFTLWVPYHYNYDQVDFQLYYSHIKNGIEGGISNIIIVINDCML